MEEFFINQKKDLTIKNLLFNAKNFLKSLLDNDFKSLTITPKDDNC